MLDRKSLKANHQEGSEDDAYSNTSREQGLECPICLEAFNTVENLPYVLWCGHTLCKNCILALQCAVIKLPTLPIQLPLFISCPWCALLSFRLFYRGTLQFPRKNYFLLWMVESINVNREKSRPTTCTGHQSTGSSNGSKFASDNQVFHSSLGGAQFILHDELAGSNNDHMNVSNYLSTERLLSSLKKSLIFFVHITSKFPLILIFLMIILYAIPTSAAILTLYIIVTVLFGIPSFLILYFAYPSLDWLVREIFN